MPRAPKDPPRIPGYEILEALGAGGQGSVWRARQKSLDRIVAIKVLWPEDASDPYLSRRFIDEARIASKLNHPNIIQVFDVGETEGTYWYAMEFVAGVTALNLFRERGPLPEGEVLEIAWQVAQALQHGCDRGLIHGDLKPENIIISPEGVAKVVDFGLARFSKRRGWRADSSHEATQGTEGFVAPEILANKSTGDARSDLFAFGVTLYELLTTTLPPGPTKSQELGPNPRERRPGTTRRTADLVMRLLAPDPAKRPESPAKVLEELGRRSSINLPATVSPVAPVKPPHSQRIRPPGSPRRKSTLLWVAALAGIAILGGAVVFLKDLMGRPTPNQKGGTGPAVVTAPPPAVTDPPKDPASRPAPNREDAPAPGASNANVRPKEPERNDQPLVTTEPPQPDAAPPKDSKSRALPDDDRPPAPLANDPPSSRTAEPADDKETPAPPKAADTETPVTEPAVTATSSGTAVYEPPAAPVGAPWIIATAAGDACEVVVRAPAGFGARDVVVDVVNEGRARGLAVKPGDAPGTHAVTFRADRTAAWGPRDFALLFKKGGASEKVRLRVQVVRPSVTGMTPNPVLRDALAYLARHQTPDGAIGAKSFLTRCLGEPRCNGEGQPACDAGVTGLCALAALHAGESGDWVRALLRYLVEAQTSDGRFAPPDNSHGAYGHIIATEACALGWHLLGDVRVRDAAQRGIDALDRARNIDANGGAWRYAVKSGDNDTSVTIWALRAILAARMAGLRTKTDSIEGGLAWLRRTTETNQNDAGYGRVGYNAPGMLTVRAQDRRLQYPPELSESLTAGALHVALQALDRKPSEKVVVSGLALVVACRPYWDGSTPEWARAIRERLGNPNADLKVMSPRDFHYWQHGASLFRTWKLLKGRPLPEDKRWNLAKLLAPHQQKAGCAAGSFDPVDPWSHEAGRAGSTAMLALALANEQYAAAFVDEVQQ